MKLKNLFIIAILSFCSITSILNGMIGEETNKISEDSKLVTVQLKDENDQVLYSTDIPYSAISLSTTLTNNLSFIDEENGTITIALDKINGISFNELKTSLQFLKNWPTNDLSSLNISSTLTKKSILKLINATDYLNFGELRTMLTKALHIKIRKIIYEKDKPLKALRFIYKMEDPDLYGKLFNLASNPFILTRKITGHDHSVIGLCISHNGKLLAGIKKRCNEIYIWSLETGELIYRQKLKGYTKFISIKFSADDRKIFLMNQKIIRIIDLANSSITKLPNFHNYNYLSISNDCTKYSQSYHSKYNDDHITIVDTATNNDLEILSGHTNKVEISAFSPDSSMLASIDEDDIIKIWDIKTSTCIESIHSSELCELVFSPNNKMLAIDNFKKILIWDIENKKRLFEINNDDYSWSMSFSPDSKLLALSSDSSIAIWDIETQACRQIIKYNDFSKTACFSPDGTQLISASSDKTINIYSKNNLSSICTLSTLLFLEYALFAKEGKNSRLPSEELYFDLYSQLPENFQKMIIELFDQEALNNYLDTQNQ